MEEWRFGTAFANSPILSFKQRFFAEIGLLADKFAKGRSDF